MQNRLQWASIGKEPNHDKNEFGGFAKSFQHRSCPIGKYSTTIGAAISFSLAIVNRDIALVSQALALHAELGQIEATYSWVLLLFSYSQNARKCIFFQASFFSFGFHIQVRKCFIHLCSSEAGLFQQGKRMHIGANHLARFYLNGSSE
jgi:hypothetical protein